MKYILKSAPKLSILLLLCLPFSSSWANTSTYNSEGVQEQTQNKAEPDDNIEVIGVVGEYSLLYFRHEMQEAELDFYEAFNKIADVEKFKVQCTREVRLGSNIRDKVCLPKYVRNRMAQETQDGLNGGGYFPKYKEIEFAVRDQREESLAYVEKVVRENPELLEKLVVLNERKARFDEAKAVKFPE